MVPHLEKADGDSTDVLLVGPWYVNKLCVTAVSSTLFNLFLFLGGGVIQTTASEATFVCLLAGRTEAIKRYQVNFEILPKIFT